MTLGIDNEKRLQILTLGGLISFFSGIILGTIKADEWTEAAWITVMIPLIVSIGIGPIAMHCYFDMTCPRGKSRQFVLIIIYNIAISFIIFVILGSLVLDDYVDISWSIALIPIWYGLIAYFLFICFMLPGLLNPEVNMQRQAFLLFLWFFAFCSFLVMLTFYLDKDSPDSFAVVVIPILIASSIQITVWGISKYKTWNSESPDKLITSEVLIVFILIITEILIILRTAVSSSIPAIVIATPGLIFLLYWIGFSIYEIIFKGAGYETLSNETLN
ncbi:unnamed protein product [Blepharisma stoltei]|uniref:SecY-independent transporter protein n=1 Tax=Blepharisma stoltei TaxID=1481888 RepID=A0AAU9IM42_9CILI|nr:unnamed protein product [Blepharisma stoltei]